MSSNRYRATAYFCLFAGLLISLMLSHYSLTNGVFIFFLLFWPLLSPVTIIVFSVAVGGHVFLFKNGLRNLSLAEQASPIKKDPFERRLFILTYLFIAILFPFLIQAYRLLGK